MQFWPHYLNWGTSISMTTGHCISVQIGPGSKIMGYYCVIDDVESFVLPWTDLWIRSRIFDSVTNPRQQVLSISGGQSQDTSNRIHSHTMPNEITLL